MGIAKQPIMGDLTYSQVSVTTLTHPPVFYSSYRPFQRLSVGSRKWRLCSSDVRMGDIVLISDYVNVMILFIRGELALSIQICLLFTTHVFPLRFETFFGL